MNASGQLPGASRAEGTAAAAGLLRVRVVEHEALRKERGVVVERRAVQEEIALLVHENLGAVTFEDLVTETGHLLPGKGVAQARAATALDTDTQTAIADALLGHQRLDLVRRGIGNLNHGN